MELNNKRILVAYFSHKGMNYCGGDIVELKKGNTEVVAEAIADITGGELFEIKAVRDYPFEYRPCTDAAKKELQAGERPELAGNIDTTPYDVIFLGYPNWWGTMPMAVWTFLESHDLKGKLVAPFCTHEGSGMGRSEGDLKKLAKGALVSAGLPIKGTNVGTAESSIRNWLKK